MSASCKSKVKAVHAVTVEIEGMTAPTTFSHLTAAVNALWESIRALLGATQYEAYKLFFGPGAVERVAAFLERDGELQLSFALSGRSHLVVVRPAGVATEKSAPTAGVGRVSTVRDAESGARRVG